MQFKGAPRRLELPHHRSGWKVHTIIIPRLFHNSAFRFTYGRLADRRLSDWSTSADLFGNHSCTAACMPSPEGCSIWPVQTHSWRCTPCLRRCQAHGLEITSLRAWHSRWAWAQNLRTRREDMCTENLPPLHAEAQPGRRVFDLYDDRLTFYLEHLKKDSDALAMWMDNKLSRRLQEAVSDRWAATIFCDVSVIPKPSIPCVEARPAATIQARGRMQLVSVTACGNVREWLDKECRGQTAARGNTLVSVVERVS